MPMMSMPGPSGSQPSSSESPGTTRQSTPSQSLDGHPPPMLAPTPLQPMVALANAASLEIERNQAEAAHHPPAPYPMQASLDDLVRQSHDPSAVNGLHNHLRTHRHAFAPYPSSAGTTGSRQASPSAESSPHTLDSAGAPTANWTATHALMHGHGHGGSAPHSPLVETTPSSSPMLGPMKGLSLARHGSGAYNSMTPSTGLSRPTSPIQLPALRNNSFSAASAGLVSGPHSRATSPDGVNDAHPLPPPFPAHQSDSIFSAFDPHGQLYARFPGIHGAGSPPDAMHLGAFHLASPKTTGPGPTLFAGSPSRPEMLRKGSSDGAHQLDEILNPTESPRLLPSGIGSSSTSSLTSLGGTTSAASIAAGLGLARGPYHLPPLHSVVPPDSYSRSAPASRAASPTHGGPSSRGSSPGLPTVGPWTGAPTSGLSRTRPGFAFTPLDPPPERRNNASE